MANEANEERRPIEEVLPGMHLHPLEGGWRPVQAFVMIKCIDEDGDTTWAYRTTHSMNLEELLGVLTVHNDMLRKELLEVWEDG